MSVTVWLRNVFESSAKGRQGRCRRNLRWQTVAVAGSHAWGPATKMLGCQQWNGEPEAEQGRKNLGVNYPKIWQWGFLIWVLGCFFSSSVFRQGRRITWRSGTGCVCVQSVKDACWFAQGLRADWKRRLPHYISDYKDGERDPPRLFRSQWTVFISILVPSCI